MLSDRLNNYRMLSDRWLPTSNCAAIAVSIKKLKDVQVPYCCRARYRNDNRDQIVIYADTPELAVRQISSNVRGSWFELFQEQEG